MRFVEPSFLYLLLLLPLLAGIGLYWSARRKRMLMLFSGKQEHYQRFNSEISKHRRTAKMILLLAAGAFMILSAARPQWGSRLEKVERRGVDVVLALDTSLSMAAVDVAPDRLNVARHSAAELMKRLAGNRVALVSFAGRAILSCPLTLDQEAAALFLDTVDLEAGPVQGTALADALNTAIGALGEPQPTDAGRGRAIILLSDGENHEEGLEEATDILRERDIPVHVIGIGTASGGPIPLLGPDGEVTGYKKDSQGRVVTTRLDEPVLEKLARRTGGKYYKVTPAGLELDGILESITGMGRGELGTVMRTRYEERFQFPLLLAVLFLLAETLVPDARAAAISTGARS